MSQDIVTKMDQKILAYYFPQYHSIPENDLVFGKDFNDWKIFTNNDNLLPRCKKPLDPPNGLGYYDPTLIDIRREQALLARKYGIDGFIYYHYWLENHVVMNKVLDKIIEDNEPDIPFCICFANESWRHVYNTPTIKERTMFHKDGSTFRQLYDNPTDHALYLSKLFKHPNYIRINNKPVLFIYIMDIDGMAYMNKICNELRKYNIDDIYLVACASTHCTRIFDNILKLERAPDAYSPFTAHWGNIDLPKILSDLPCVYGELIGWDTVPRHGKTYRLIDHKPNEIVKNICNKLLSMKNDDKSPQICAIFAWNEWGEGGVIEPNNIYGENIGYAIAKAREIVNMLQSDDKLINTKFEYGADNNFKDITNMVHLKCIDQTDTNIINNDLSKKWVIYIPKHDYNRDKLFGDHLPYVHKVIKVSYNNIISTYDETQEIILPIIN